MSETNTYPTWRTIRRGVYKSLEAYLAAAEAKGKTVPESSQRMLVLDVVWAQEEVEVELVLASGKDLGLDWGYSPAEAEEIAAARGLYPCDPEDAACLHVQCDDLDMDENYWLTMAYHGEIYVYSYYVCRHTDYESPDEQGSWTEIGYDYDEVSKHRMNETLIRVWTRRPPGPAAATPAPPA